MTIYLVKHLANLEDSGNFTFGFVNFSVLYRDKRIFRKEEDNIGKIRRREWDN